MLNNDFLVFVQIHQSLAKIIYEFKAFDDVLRTKHKSEANAAYRASVSESEIVKKSLAEVYEEQYQKTQYGVMFQFLRGFIIKCPK